MEFESIKITSFKTISAPNKLFEKKEDSYLKNLSKNYIYECVLFQNSKSKPFRIKTLFMRIYDNFFILSKVLFNFSNLITFLKVKKLFYSKGSRFQ